VREYQIDNLIEIGFALSSLGLMLWLVASAVRRSTERQHEIRLRLLEKANPEELTALLASADGREWLGRFLSGGMGGSELAGSTLQRPLILIGVGLYAALSALVVRFNGHEAVAVGGFLSIGWGLALLGARRWILRKQPGESSAKPPDRPLQP
jgi:hypothetical protein